MELHVSVATPEGERDLAIAAPGDAAVPAIAAALADAAGVREPLYAGGRALDGGRFDDGTIRPGAVLTTAPATGDTEPPAGVRALEVVAGPGAGRRVALGRGRLIIGRDAGCDVVIDDPDVSRRHAAVGVAGGRVRVRDLGSTNGTLLDGRPVGDAPVTWPAGARLRVGDCLLALTETPEPPASTRPGRDGTHRVLRPPRGPEPPAVADVTWPERPAPPRPGRVQWLSALLPALGGVGLAWWARSPQFLLFALLSPLMLISAALGDRLHWRRSRRRSAADHRRAVADAGQQVAAALVAEARARWAAAPDPATLYRVATLPGRSLWARRAGDPDGLRVRLGVGDVPARLAVRRDGRTQPAGILASVPVEVDLRSGPLGLAGPAGTVDAVAAWVVSQLAVHHAPGEVELAVLLDGQQAGAWSWARWLPHVRARAATGLSGAAELVAGCRATVEARRRVPGPWRGPWLVLVVDRAAEAAAVAGLADLLTDGPPVGVTAICIDTDPARLPAGCRSTAEVRGETGTRLAVRRAPEAEGVVAVADRVPPGWPERVARALAAWTDGSGPAALPGQVGLLAALGLIVPEPAAVLARWSGSSGGARAVIGTTADGPLSVDLATDGPHALVAGTTGAGKSELLQALVASLAANHPPEETAFLLVDYKGGAAFAECARLPHVAGLVTDLDPYLTERALRSLDAELRRRETLLAEAGVADLTAYRATARAPGAGSASAEPLPRLVIVVDEFATLTAELPDFVRGLVSVAQRGRSLGVHLVLATQRPGSAVSPEIRANTALRFCLRVTDPGESTDVLGAPDAAALDPTTPGRGYLRAGAAVTAFQSAFPSGSTPDEDAITVEPLGPWRRRAQPSGGSASDLARLVAAISGAAETTGRSRARQPWTPPLPDELPAAALGPPPRATSVRLGRIDRPELQRWDELDVDLAAGDNVLFAGAARSGRTEALTALALGAAVQLSPRDLAIYVVDPAGRLAAALAGLPHVATSLGPAAVGLVPRLLALLERGASAADRPPAGLLLVDGWDRVQATLPDIEAAAAGELLAQLLRVAPAAGLTVALAGDRSVLMPRVSAGFPTRLLLRQAEVADFGLAGLPARGVPPRMPPGRGLLADGAAVQLARARSADSVRAGAGADVPDDGRVRLRPLPDRVRVGELPAVAGGVVIGLAGDRAELLSLDPFAGAGRLLVAGPPRSGRSTTLRVLAEQAAAAGTRTMLAAPPRSPLAATASRLRLPLVGPDGPDPGPAPAEPTLLLVDDCEAFADRPVADRLSDWLRTAEAPLAAVVAGRSDELATSYRGLGAAARRAHCGVLLRPGPVDGELLGVRLPRRPAAGPPGRGVIVGDPAWGRLFADGEPVPLQVAAP